MRNRNWLAVGACSAWLAAGAFSTAAAEPLRIAYGTWVGYGPLLVAAEEGFFAKHDVAVELIKIDDHTAAFAALLEGQVDALGASAQDLVTFVATEGQPGDAPLVCILALNASRGADGVLASNDIETIADLEGRSVAAQKGSTAHFYLNVLLKKAGLEETDVELVDLPSADATTAFMLKEVDAVVTYEPFLTAGKATDHGHLLVDTRDTPGLLMDCLIAKEGTFNAVRDSFVEVGQAWDDAIAFIRDQPEEANRIMARALGDWLSDPVLLADILKGLEFFDLTSNRQYFGTPAEPGPIYQTMGYAIEMWTSAGALKRRLDPSDFVAHGILGEEEEARGTGR
jgi:NitT/TauT family transport system substrate-binding protein